MKKITCKYPHHFENFSKMTLTTLMRRFSVLLEVELEFSECRHTPILAEEKMGTEVLFLNVCIVQYILGRNYYLLTRVMASEHFAGGRISCY